MLKEAVIFLLGAASVALALLLFSVEFPVIQLWDLPALEALKYGISIFTAAGIILALLLSGS